MRSGDVLITGSANPLGSSIDIVALALSQARSRGISTCLTHLPEILANTEDLVSQADHQVAMDPADPSETLIWLQETRESFDLVLGLRDDVVLTAAEASQRLGLPGNSPDVVRLVRNKDLCRAALRDAGFRQPQYLLCFREEEARRFMTDSNGPWVIKPRDGMASQGVSLVNSLDDLPNALDALPNAEAPFIVEQFVVGPEISAEGVFIDGCPMVLAITAKETSSLPHFVELGHVIPAPMGEAVQREITQDVEAALRTVGLRQGIFHVELWLTEAGVVLGEIHGRPGGDWIHKLMALVLPEVELFGLVYDDALGNFEKPQSFAMVPRSAAAVRFLTAPAGRIRAVHGWKDALAAEGIVAGELTLDAGDTARVLRGSEDRAGMIMATGADSLEAQRRAASAAALVVFDVE